MARRKTIFVCQECGNESPRWTGQCSACRAWNSLVEETSIPVAAGRSAALGLLKTDDVGAIALDEIEPAEKDRLSTGVGEIDRVLGGGIVPGSAVLVAGDPGIGKSTLMTEFARHLDGSRILYVTGEESPRQVKMRADRLCISGPQFRLLPETDVEAIIRLVIDEEPDILIVDSIQTLYKPALQSAPGSVAQVRESAAALIQMAKKAGVSLFMVGHVTKDGAIAGPRVLEHMVDTVLYLEGDRHHAYRLLRAVKNRFGSTNEIGVFEMRQSGLEPVGNPSSIFLSNRSEKSAGAVVVCSMEGTRPILAEIQALVTQSTYATGQRSATGYDMRRLQMLLAVLEKREGLHLSTTDVFVNVTGGLRLTEPAVDLGIVAAVASSFRESPVDRDAVLIGEIGLSGEIRSVAHLEPRVQEAAHLGFTKAFVPAFVNGEMPRVDGVVIQGVHTLHELIDRIL